MAWNRSISNIDVNPETYKKPRGISSRVMVWSFLVLIISVVCALLFVEPHFNKNTNSSSAKEIVSVSISDSQTFHSTSNRAEILSDSNIPKNKLHTSSNTGQSDIPTENVVTNDGSFRPRDRFAVLPLNCDKQIAGLVYAVPGQLMIGTVDFDEDFDEQFKESLKTGLEPSADASDEEREIIATINEAKDSIVQMMKREGKTASEIMSETRHQLCEFGKYKYLLKSEIIRYENDENKTDEDVSDLFDAANKMLRDNGIEPFEPNDLTRDVVRLHKFDQMEIDKGDSDE